MTLLAQAVRELREEMEARAIRRITNSPPAWR